jgi:hypothetical protein
MLLGLGCLMLMAPLDSAGTMAGTMAQGPVPGVPDDVDVESDEEEVIAAPGALDGAAAMYGLPAEVVPDSEGDNESTLPVPYPTPSSQTKSYPTPPSELRRQATRDAQFRQSVDELAQPGPAAPLAGEIKRDIFSNQWQYCGTASGYTNTVQIDTTTFYIVEAKPEVEANFRRQIKGLEREAKDLVKLATQIEAQQEAGDVDDAALESQLQELEKREQNSFVMGAKAQEYLIEHTVLGWSDPTWSVTPPCNTETRKALAPAVKSELCAFIFQATKVKGSEASFLSPS